MADELQDSAPDTRSSFKTSSEGGQAHFAPRTAQNEPVPGGFETSKSAPLAHIVFFTLAEPSDANRSKLVEGCKKYLDGHEGIVYFGVGVNAPEYAREVNDRDYDVALHLVFETARHQDVYQTHPRHVKFVEECKGLWKRVRVFDSRLK